MNPATITALLAGVTGVITAVVSLVHALSAKGTANDAVNKAAGAIAAVKDAQSPKEGALQ